MSSHPTQTRKNPAAWYATKKKSRDYVFLDSVSRSLPDPISLSHQARRPPRGLPGGLSSLASSSAASSPARRHVWRRQRSCGSSDASSSCAAGVRWRRMREAAQERLSRERPGTRRARERRRGTLPGGGDVLDFVADLLELEHDEQCDPGMLSKTRLTEAVAKSAPISQIPNFPSSYPHPTAFPSLYTTTCVSKRL